MMVWETRKAAESDDDRIADKLTRRESAAQRSARIARKVINPQTAAAIRAAFGGK